MEYAGMNILEANLFSAVTPCLLACHRGSQGIITTKDASLKFICRVNSPGGKILAVSHCVSSLCAEDFAVIHVDKP